MTSFSLQGQRIWVAGHRGMVGSAIMRRLASEPVGAVLTASSRELDMRRQGDVELFVARERPDVLILAAAKVGGINANQNAQGEFLYDNLMIATNALEAARAGGVKKVVVLGSSCIYPKLAPQPLQEDALLTGALEETNEGYAIAKIAALELGKMYRRQYGFDVVSLMPTNLYGPGDNYDLETSHVLPALLRKVHQAKERKLPSVELWGSGTPLREFLHVDDLADATIHALKNVSQEQHLNVGTGQDISIRDLAGLIAEIVGWEGEFTFNTDMPDGTPRKLLDVSQLQALGWQSSVDLRDGIESVYQEATAGGRSPWSGLASGDVPMALEVIESKGVRYAEVLRAGHRVEQTTFFSPAESSFQFGLFAHSAGFVEAPHYHQPFERTVGDLQQVLVIQRGRLAIDLFDDDGVLIAALELLAGDSIVLIHGTHAVRTLEDTQAITVKQGPFLGDENDKVDVEVQA